MRRVPVPWLTVFAIAAVGVAATYVECPGCIPRDRVNDRCEWTEEAGATLDLRNRAHQTHLVEDAQLAEELGIRYADAEHGRRFGVAHHGGLLEGGRVRADCLAEMFQAVETAHDVTPAQVQLARGRRNGTYDLAVALLFVPFYLLCATLVSGRLARRFPSDERLAALVATGLVSIAAALAGQQVFRLWGAVWEVVRVGNGHMTSIRAASKARWASQYPGAELVAALVIFWIVALIVRRAASDSPVGDKGPLEPLQIA
jgi:hypothetical protein